jgi:hypothetical protein
MKNQNCVSCLENYGTTNQKLLRLYIFTLITLLTHSCDGGASGQVINATMFEIPSKDQKSYMLRDCRKMAGDDIDCKCAYLGRECQQADVENCRNCSCLDGSTKIFYVKKRYGAVCLSVNNVFNAGKFIFGAGCSKRGENYSEKSVRRFLGLENPGNFSWDSGIFSPNSGIWGFFQLIFSKYFPLFFFAELFPTFFATYNYPSNYF